MAKYEIIICTEKKDGEKEIDRGVYTDIKLHNGEEPNGVRHNR